MSRGAINYVNPAVLQESRNGTMHWIGRLASVGCQCDRCQELSAEAWERMTYGGVQLDKRSRRILSWLADMRFTPYGDNYWIVNASR